MAEEFAIIKGEFDIIKKDRSIEFLKDGRLWCRAVYKEDGRLEFEGDEKCKRIFEKLMK